MASIGTVSSLVNTRVLYIYLECVILFYYQLRINEMPDSIPFKSMCFSIIYILNTARLIKDY